MKNIVFYTVIGLEKNYEISKCGIIRRVNKTKSFSYPKGTINKKGYLMVSIYLDGYKQVLLHRLVAKNFIPNPENKPQINHINGIKTDNRIENLEWCTCKENIQHAVKNNLISDRSGEKNNISKLKNSDIPKIRSLIKLGETNVKIGLLYGVDASTISKIKRNISYLSIK